MERGTLRVAIIGSRGYPSTYGGFETLVRRLAPALRERGHEVTVYGRENGPLHRVQMVDGVASIRSAGLNTKTLSTLTYGLSSSVDASVRRYDAALVVNVANGLYLPLLKTAGIPTVVNVDGMEWQRGKWGRAARSVFRRGAHLTAKTADCVVADSREIQTIWRRDFGVNAVYIPYGGNVNHVSNPARVRQLGLEPQEYVLLVARLAPENNIDMALDAFDQMEPAPVAVVVGSANYASPLERRLRTLASQGRVAWLGHVSDQELLLDLWSSAGVYVHGHSVGGTNPALVQALGMGAPTAAFASPFNREVVGDAAVLFEDAVSLASHIRTLLGNRQMRTRLSKAGKKRVERHFRWQDVCDAYGEELERAAVRK